MNSFVKGRQLHQSQLDRSQLAQLARLPTGKAFEIPTNTPQRRALHQDDTLDSESEVTASDHGANIYLPSLSANPTRASDTVFKRPEPPRSLQSYPTTTSGNESVTQTQGIGQRGQVGQESAAGCTDDGSKSEVEPPEENSTTNWTQRRADSKAKSFNHAQGSFPNQSLGEPVSKPFSHSYTNRSTSEPRSQINNAEPGRFQPYSAEHHSTYDEAHPSITDYPGGDLPIRSSERGSEDDEGLDYDRGDLYIIPFEDLQEESFDVDPRKRPISREKSSPALADSLSHIVTADEQEQLQYLDSLMMNEWNATGKWIAEQDGRLRTALVRNREARRSITLEFEAEISSRHESVRKMQAGISDKLAQMKRSGGLVLANGASS